MLKYFLRLCFHPLVYVPINPVSIITLSTYLSLIRSNLLKFSLINWVWLNFYQWCVYCLQFNVFNLYLTYCINISIFGILNHRVSPCLSNCASSIRLYSSLPFLITLPCIVILTLFNTFVEDIHSTNWAMKYCLSFTLFNNDADFFSVFMTALRGCPLFPGKTFSIYSSFVLLLSRCFISVILSRLMDALLLIECPHVWRYYYVYITRCP